MDAQQFRAKLAARGLSQAGFARLLISYGDPRQFPTLLRSVANWALGVRRPPGEVVVIFNLLDQLDGKQTG